MEYVFVKYSDNYADEFDVECVWVVRKELWQKWADNIRTNIKHEVEIYFGTNEYIEIEDGETVVNNCEVRDISEDEARTIAKYFGEPWSDLEGAGITIGLIDVFSSLDDKVSEETDAPPLMEEDDDKDETQEVDDSVLVNNAPFAAFDKDATP